LLQEEDPVALVDQEEDLEVDPVVASVLAVDHLVVDHFVLEPLEVVEVVPE
jgi:hypothetical protein